MKGPAPADTANALGRAEPGDAGVKCGFRRSVTQIGQITDHDALTDRFTVLGIVRRREKHVVVV